MAKDTPRPRSARILIIDDDVPLTAVVQERFKRETFLTLSALNGSEGLMVAQQERPDLIVLDLLMPVMNGFDVLKALKDNAETRDIPVLVLSNLSHPDDVRRTKSLGANGYLVKTDTSLKAILERVKQMIGVPPSAPHPTIA